MFQLVFGDHDLTLPLHFDARVEDQLTTLVALDVESSTDEKARRSTLAALIVDAITAVVDPTSAAPTEKQIRYAKGIARELDVPLPAEVLRYRGMMGLFLDQNAAKYRAKLRSRRSGSTTGKQP